MEGGLSQTPISHWYIRLIWNASSLFGFLTGTVVAGSAVYYYILGEYRVSNEMLTEDIFVCFLYLPILYHCYGIISLGYDEKANELPSSEQALQAATQKLQTYIQELENKVDQLQKKK